MLAAAPSLSQPSQTVAGPSAVRVQYGDDIPGTFYTPLMRGIKIQQFTQTIFSMANQKTQMSPKISAPVVMSMYPETRPHQRI